MKFIIVHVPQIPGDKAALRPAGRNVDAYQQMLRENEEQVRLADQLGFYGYATAQHHFHTEGFEVMPQPLIYYSKLAALTENIKFIPMSLVPVSTNPLAIAEEVALFDNLFPGRVEVGVARGYQSRWMQTMAQDVNVTSGMPGTESDTRNREIFNEYMDVIKMAWTEDAFSFKGKYFEAPYPNEGLDYPAAELARTLGSEGEVNADGTVAKIGVVPKPYTQPFPKIWVPFTLSPSTLTAAATGGYNMLLNPSNPTVMHDFMTKFQAEAHAAGRELKLGEGIAALRDVVIGETEDHAFELAVRGSGSLFFNYFQHFGFMENWRDETDDPDQKPLKFDTVEKLTKRMVDQRWIMAGTLDQVIEQLDDTRSCYGNGADLEYIAYHMGIQGVDQKEALNQLQLIGEHIIPKFA